MKLKQKNLAKFIYYSELIEYRYVSVKCLNY